MFVVVLVAATALEEEKLSQEDADEGRNSFIAFELGYSVLFTNDLR